VRWALELKGVAFQSNLVDLLTGEEKGSAYKALNPAGYLPTLVVDQKYRLSESVAIIEWLEETLPNSRLLPMDPYLRAAHRRLAETVNSGIQPLQNLDVMKKVSDDKDKQNQWVVFWIERGLQVVEEIAVSTRATLNLGKPRFLLSDSPQYSDLFLIPQVYSAHRFKVDMNRFPICEEIYQRALGTEACQRAHPDKYQNPS
jgi:maleylacetoacetate isomerase